MSLLDHDSRNERAVQRRPPPVIVMEPALDSPSAPAITGAAVAVRAGPIMLMPGTKFSGEARLAPTVAGPLSALAGPTDRPPLLYAGDATASLATLRQDIVSSYRTICGALGEPERSDLVNGSLPAAAALGLPVPSVHGAAERLPALLGGAGLSSATLLLPPAPSAQTAAPGSPGFSGSVAMGLGNRIGIEAVGAGAAVPARFLTSAESSWGSIDQAPAGPRAGMRSGNSLVGALRSLSAGHGVPPLGAGLPPLALNRGAGNHWPMGRPLASNSRDRARMGFSSGSGGSDGPRVAIISGFSQPQDPNSDFLGEETAIVYPPAGRNFGGGASAAARAAAGGAGMGLEQIIDAMDDFRFRGGGRKHIKIEDLDDPTRLVPGFRMNDGMQLEVFLKEYARNRSEPRTEQQRGGSRYRMPF